MKELSLLVAAMVVQLVMPRFEAWFGRRQLIHTNVVGPFVLHYPECMSYVSLTIAGGCGFFGGIALITGILVCFHLWPAASCLFVAGMSLLACAIYALFARDALLTFVSRSDRIVITQDGLECDTYLTGCRNLLWKDVVRIRYRLIGWIQVVAVDETVLWISLNMCNISTLATVALAAVDAESIDWYTTRCLLHIADSARS